MNFPRRLQAPTNPQYEAYSTATGVAAQNAIVEQLVPVDASQWQPVFATLAYLAENPGVPDHTTPESPVPTAPTGEN